MKTTQAMPHGSLRKTNRIGGETVAKFRRYGSLGLRAVYRLGAAKRELARLPKLSKGVTFASLNRG